MLLLLKRWFIVLPAVCGTILASAQDSCHLRISLLTCTPGSELYSIFGHSALRVRDSVVGTDIVYNYGTFRFDDPDFYTKFVRGKLLYYLSQENFSDFRSEYQMDERGIDEQVLNLNCSQEKEIQQFLFQNLQGDNAYYKYDFLFDNCTTRLRDIIEKFEEPGMRTGLIPEAANMTFRNAIHYYLDKGRAPWSKFGIDMLLGSHIDRKMSNSEAMFLPEFLEKGIDITGKKGDTIVLKKEYPLMRPTAAEGTSALPGPFFVFSLMAIALIALGLAKHPLIRKVSGILNTVLLMTIGVLGCVIIFMWFGTDHVVTGYNYNLFWAWPTHIFMPFFRLSTQRWMKKYFLLYTIVVGIVLLAWPLWPQQMNPAIIPLLILSGWVSWNYAKRYEVPRG